MKFSLLLKGKKSKNLQNRKKRKSEIPLFRFIFPMFRLVFPWFPIVRWCGTCVIEQNGKYHMALQCSWALSWRYRYMTVFLLLRGQELAEDYQF